MSETLLGGGSESTGGETKAEPEVNTFRESLPEEYRDHAVLSNFKSVGDLAKSWTEAQKKIGEKGAFPKKGEDEAPDEWNEFYNRAGRPKTPDEYELDGAGDDFKSLVENMHKAGLNKNQAKKVYGALEAMAQARAEASSSAAKESYDNAYREIVKEYGSEDAAKEALGQATGFIDKHLSENFGNFLREATIKIGDKEMALADHPLMAKTFKDIADMFGDDTRNLKGESAEAKEDMFKRYQALSLEIAGLDRYRDAAILSEKQAEFVKLKNRLYPPE
jgi:hypothetical protein